MSFFSDSMVVALRLVAAADPDVLQAMWTSLASTLACTAIAAAIGVPIGATIGIAVFRGKRFVTTLLNTLLAIPTVVIGLGLYGFLSRQGMLGSFRLLFTPAALVMGQSVLALPIVTNLAVTAVHDADPRILQTALTLGAGRLATAVLLLREVRFAMVAAVVAGFGRVVSEVGVAMMLGGNIRGYTRTMTTAIALETSKGDFARGIALGLILMAVALFVNVSLSQLQLRSRE